MKKLYLFAALAAMLAACSSDNLVEEKQSPQTQVTADAEGVNFDVYVNRGITRAGTPGELTTTTIKEGAHQTDGFGVFAYYTDGEQYAGTTTPNFMYNEHVTYGGSATGWVYSPVKYWPNEFGSDAVSDQVDRVSFFAYAPYVAVTPQTGMVTDKKTENITAMTRNNATGDPYVRYTATMDAKNSVDLCYGVSAEHFTSSNSTVFPNDIAEGAPFVDVSKPALASKLKFNFKHALSRLNVLIDAVVDQTDPTSSNLKEQTKIWVRSVTFEGITLKGQLNLRDGKWYAVDASGDNEIASGSVTVYDGRKDGKEPVGAASNEYPATLNSTIVQSLPYDKADLPTLQTTDEVKVKGVTETAQNLFNSSTDADPIFVIPTGETMKVTIVYDVETYDQKLAQYLSDGVTPGSTIQNTISKTVDAFGQLKAGLYYKLHLHLGLRSVEFDAAVEPWPTSPIETHTDLPYNAPMLATGSPYTLGSTVVPASATNYQFKVTGLKASEAVTETNGTTSGEDLVTGVDDVSADANGMANIKATFSANKTVHKRYGWVQAVGDESDKGAKVSITQEAHELGLTYSSATSTSITVTTSSDLDAGETFKTDLSGLDNTKIKVVDMADASESNLFTSATGLVLTTSTLVSGHTYKVTVTAGDVTESFIEQISF